MAKASVPSICTAPMAETSPSSTRPPAETVIPWASDTGPPMVSVPAPVLVNEPVPEKPPLHVVLVLVETIKAPLSTTAPPIGPSGPAIVSVPDSIVVVPA